MRKIILASSSPRRIELLSLFNIKFDVIPSDCDETIEENLSPYDVALNLAEKKATSVAFKVPNNSIVIAADTIVFKDGKIFGKPVDEKDAYNMLSSLSGDFHKVITGVCIIDNSNDKKYKSYEETLVYFKKLTDKEIIDYINTGEPLDKAGAYGIQRYGSLFVEKIEGCYFNVVGFPINKIYNALGDMGVNLLTGEI